MTIRFRLTRWILQVERIRSPYLQSEAKILNKIGSYIMRSARRSMKSPALKLREMTATQRQQYRIAQWYAKKKGLKLPRKPLSTIPSRPGEPPRAKPQTGAPLKNFLFYAYSSVTHSVVIGPQILPRKRQTAPQSLEYGGETFIAGGPLEGLPYIMLKRPYMAPAMLKELPKLEGLWRNAIR